MAIHRRAMKAWLGDVAEVVAPHHLERTELAAERALQPLQQLRDLVEARQRNERAVGLLVASSSRTTTRVTTPSVPSLPMNNRSEEHTSELQSLMRISSAVFCLNKKTNT